jgi:hypothetical protein
MTTAPLRAAGSSRSQPKRASSCAGEHAGHRGMALAGRIATRRHLAPRPYERDEGRATPPPLLLLRVSRVPSPWYTAYEARMATSSRRARDSRERWRCSWSERAQVMGHVGVPAAPIRPPEGRALCADDVACGHVPVQAGNMLSFSSRIKSTTRVSCMVRLGTLMCTCINKSF